jgi:hypothetical protein
MIDRWLRVALKWGEPTLDPGFQETGWPDAAI